MSGQRSISDYDPKRTKAPAAHAPRVGTENEIAARVRAGAPADLPDDVSVCSPHGLGSATIPISSRQPPFRTKKGDR